MLAQSGYFILLAVAAVAIFGLFNWWREQRRGREFEDLADRLGLTYQAEADGGLISDDYAPLELFDRGHDRLAKHLMYGNYKDQSVLVCAYTYVTGSGRDQTTHNSGLAMLNLKLLLPHVLIRHEHFTDRLASWVGMEDIDFESDEFSRRFVVKCEDRKFAYELIDPGMIEFLLAQQKAYQWEVSGNWVAMWREDYLNLHEAEDMFAALIGFQQRVPRLVQREHPIPSNSPLNESGQGFRARR